MALTCPIDLDVATLRAEVQTMYSRVASAPTAISIFIAVRNTRRRARLRRTELAALPPEVTSVLCGVGNPHAIGRIPAGRVVVDCRLRCRDGSLLGGDARRTARAGDRCRHDRCDARACFSRRRGLRTVECRGP